MVFVDHYKFLDLVQHINDLEDTNPDRIDWARKLFELFDQSGEGKISKAVAKKGIEMIGVEIENEEDFFEVFSDDDGKVKINKIIGKHSKSSKKKYALRTYFAFSRRSQAHEK